MHTTHSLTTAPFGTRLRVESYGNLSQDIALVLRQLGLNLEEPIEKLHVAPLGDPLTIRIGRQRYSLRKEICDEIVVSRDS